MWHQKEQLFCSNVHFYAFSHFFSSNFLFLSFFAVFWTGVRTTSSGKLSWLMTSVMIVSILTFFMTLQVTFSKKGTKITPQTHIQNFWFPWNFIMKSIPQCSFPFRLMWYTFLNKKHPESLWFYWYCLRNCQFQIF